MRLPKFPLHVLRDYALLADGERGVLWSVRAGSTRGESLLHLMPRA